MAAITAYYIMGKTFTGMIFTTKFNGIIPIGIGTWTVILIARWCDKNIQSNHVFYKGMIIPIFIFSIGVITGCLLNLMNASGHQTFAANFFDYFFKPVYWLGLIGLPATAIIGLGHYFINANKTLT